MLGTFGPADTLAWALTRDPDRSWVAGLSTADERELIAAWWTRRRPTSCPDS
ncbi:MAG TPA: hypothetical protein VLJ88_11930 [Propionibacteriaceae bacterium]|nr:hypothetical protein [Propionibacteriaceae bacterium]